MDTDGPAKRKGDTFAQLPLTGPDTPMGKLLRKFWHPVAVGKDLKPGTAQPLRVLSEDLTLYRGETGAPFLVGGRCAHRCTKLHTGWVNGDEISCMYHGWRYDGTGLCVDRPAEKRPRSRPIKIAGYPLQEYAGLIFAYLGEGAPPEFDLPRKPVFDDPNRIIIADKQTWDCNWFQQVENSLDAVHLSFAHVWGAVKQFGNAIGTSIPDLAYDETSAGIQQTATRSPTNVRISNWTFPNNNHVIAPGPRPSDPWIHVGAWPTPADDTHTMRFTLYSIEKAWAETVDDLDGLFGLNYEPAEHARELFGSSDLSHLPEMSLITAQDYVAVAGQGAIVDRSQENLASSDVGVAFVRGIFLRELDAIQRGEPTKVWRPLDRTPDLPKPDIGHAAE